MAYALTGQDQEARASRVNAFIAQHQRANTPYIEVPSELIDGNYVVAGGVFQTKQAYEQSNQLKQQEAAGQMKNIGTPERPLYVPVGSAADVLQQAPQSIAPTDQVNIGTEQAPLYVPKGSPAEQNIRGKVKGTESQPLPFGLTQEDLKNPAVQISLQQQGYDPVTGKKIVKRLPGESIEDFTKKQEPQEIDQKKAPAVQTSDQIRAQEKKQSIDEIKKSLASEAPQVFKSSEEYARLRKEQGIIQDEGELSSIQQEMLLGQQELRQFRQTSGQTLSQAGYLGGVSEAERNLNFRLEGLAIRERGVLDRVNSKNAFISNAIQLGLNDYSTALTAYNSEYTRNLKAVDMYNEQLNDQQKDALTSLTTITNLFKDKQVDPSAFSQALKTQINTLELQAGIPVGTYETALLSIPNEKITPITVDNASGGKDVYFIGKDKNQPPVVYNLPGAGEKVEHSPIYKEWQDAVRSGYKGNFVQYQNEDANRKRSVTTNVFGGLTGGQFNRINTIVDNSRQDPNINTFPAVRASFETARSSAGKKTSAGDIALMRMVAKITDPTTGVREEEYRTFQGAIGTLPAFGIQMTSQMIGKGQLTDFGRKQLLDIVEDIYNQRKEAYNIAYNQGLKQIKGQGGTEEDFIPYVIAPEPKKDIQQKVKWGPGVKRPSIKSFIR